MKPCRTRTPDAPPRWEKAWAPSKYVVAHGLQINGLAYRAEVGGRDSERKKVAATSPAAATIAPMTKEVWKVLSSAAPGRAWPR